MAEPYIRTTTEKDYGGALAYVDPSSPVNAHPDSARLWVFKHTNPACELFMSEANRGWKMGDRICVINDATSTIDLRVLDALSNLLVTIPPANSRFIYNRWNRDVPGRWTVVVPS